MRGLTRFTFLILFVSFLFVSAKPSTDTAHFYFIQITDTHWGDGNHLELTKKAVEAIKTLPMKIEFIVHTGDLTARTVLDTVALDSGLAVLKSASIPLYFVAGNRDIDKNNPLTFKNFRSKVGPFINQAEYYGVKVVFACTQPLAESFSIPDYSPLTALTDALGKSKGKPALLFVHSVPCSDFYNNSFHDTWPQKNKKDFETAVDTSSVLAIIGGHFHRSDFYWIGNCPVYISPSVASYFGREASFRIYEYRNGKLSIIAQYIH